MLAGEEDPSLRLCDLRGCKDVDSSWQQVGNRSARPGSLSHTFTDAALGALSYTRVDFFDPLQTKTQLGRFRLTPSPRAFGPLLYDIRIPRVPAGRYVLSQISIG